MTDLKGDTSMYMIHRLHRRDLLQRLGASVGVLGLLAVCAPAEAAAATAAPAAAQQGGGKTLTIGEWQQVSIMNTLMTSEGGNVISGTKLALRGLLFIDGQGAPTGELATDVPSTQNGGISADGKTISYRSEERRVGK